MSNTSILNVENVTVSFDGFKALNNLNFSVDEGELRCVIGPNGAGKTTLMDAVTGKIRPDMGTMRLNGSYDLSKMDETAIAQAGIGRKFQKPTVFEQHSVFENIELALQANKGVWSSLFAKLSNEDHTKIDDILNTVGLTTKRETLAGLLSHGQKQWLEIGMLLAQNPRVLLVDEPVAGMTPQEVVQTGELLISLAGDHSVVVVEHDMDFVRSIARKVTVLHEGSVLAEGTMDEIQNDSRVIEVYLGH
ncbi:MAG: urea ABC transporter ATP-binding protein UrtD [Deltaproteobacteria bacterium]|jgi:urea transport system ATP-binding protein|nr:urea ABC transporter ATP-binding protein UrtD [Deltaproteobacteria bacterium]MBT6490610.1 urea ABC transporter ATP-binding protein UrtD [Deltaproteobacteria bacterium]